MHARTHTHIHMVDVFDVVSAYYARTNLYLRFYKLLLPTMMQSIMLMFLMHDS